MRSRASIHTSFAPAALRLVDEPLDFHAVYDAHAAYVAAVALRILGRSADVDDVVHDVFIKVLRQLAQLEDPAAIKGWLARITVGVCSKRLRRKKLLAWIGLGDVEASLEATDCAPDEHARLSEVYAALAELAVDDRVAWTLRHVEGERLDAIANACGCSLATAKRRIARAEAQLDLALMEDER